MPDAMPRPIAKGKLLNALDEFLNGANAPNNRNNLTNELKNLAQTVLEAADNAGFGFPPGTRSHLEKHWFGLGDYGGEWWEELQPTGQILRYGLLDAIDRAVGPPLKPIYSYWVCGPEILEVAAAVTAQQVTVLIVTPMPPTMGPVIEFDQAAPCEHIFETTVDPGVVQLAAQPGAAKGVITLQQKKEL